MMSADGPRPDVLTDDPDAIGRLWYVAPKPTGEKKGWLVYSREMVLQVLQGCYGHADHVRHTAGWLCIAALVQAAMAALQLLVMAIGVVPVLRWFVGVAAQYSGRNPLGFFLRSCYWKVYLKRLGQDTLFDQGADIWGAERVEIGHDCFLGANVRLSCGQTGGEGQGSITLGDYTFIGPGSLLSGGGTIRIGDFVAISAAVHLYSATNTMLHPRHRGQLPSMAHCAPPDRQGVVSGTLEVGDYAMVGVHSVVLPGVSLGRGAIVHPFTEVQRSFPAFANVVGPGRARQNGWRRPPELDQRREPDARERQ